MLSVLASRAKGAVYSSTSCARRNDRRVSFCRGILPCLVVFLRTVAALAFLRLRSRQSSLDASAIECRRRVCAGRSCRARASCALYWPLVDTVEEVPVARWSPCQCRRYLCLALKLCFLFRNLCKLLSHRPKCPLMKVLHNSCHCSSNARWLAIEYSPVENYCCVNCYHDTPSQWQLALVAL